MQRVARGSGRWTELTLDGLNKLMLLVEERLFPGEELAAAMAAATVGDTLAPTAAAAATSGPGVPGAREGDVARASSVSSEMEGGWGEDGTTAGALSHLVECMLEVSFGGLLFVLLCRIWFRPVRFGRVEKKSAWFGMLFLRSSTLDWFRWM